jgi:molecular chaperone DnaK
VEVTFDIDANGIVNVSAKDLGTGKEQKIQITPSSGLNEEEIKRMVADADKHRSEDEKRKKVVNAKNELDGLTYSVEKTLKENESKVDASVKSELESAIATAKSALESNDYDKMKSALEGVQKASNKMAEQLYKQAGANAQGAGPSPGDGNGHGGNGAEENTQKTDKTQAGDDVIDADFKEL